MKSHKWKIKTIDAGPLGLADFWECSECGAAGGPAWPGKGDDYDPKTDDWVFYADGSGLDLTTDCEESARLIAEHLARPKRRRRT